MMTAAKIKERRAQAMMEYIVVIMAVILAVSWAIGPARKMFTDHAKVIEKGVRDLF